MDFFEVLTTRRSIRSFLPDPVTQEERDILIKAGTLAPSAMNRQPWSFILVDQRDLLQAIAERHPHAQFAARAPLAIVVCATPAEAAGGFWPQDCAAATQNILLAARALSLGSVWCGLYPAEDLVPSVAAFTAQPVEVSVPELLHVQESLVRAYERGCGLESHSQS